MFQLEGVELFSKVSTNQMFRFLGELCRKYPAAPHTPPIPFPQCSTLHMKYKLGYREKTILCAEVKVGLEVVSKDFRIYIWCHFMCTTFD
jgi:hypothetical protein